MASFLVTRSLLARLANHQHSYPMLQGRVLGETRAFHSTGNSQRQSQSGLPLQAESLKEELVCRVCAGSACTPLRESLGDGDVMSALRVITGVPIKVEDKLPKYICTKCLERLKAALAFRQECQENDRQFRRSLAREVSTPMSHPYSKHNFQLILHNMNVKRIEARERTQKEIVKRANRQKRKVKKKRAAAGKFKCQPCGLSFATKCALNTHRLRRACMRHPCHICGQLVLSLRQHVRTSHGQGRAHKCGVCGKEFPIIARLRSHRLVHENKFNFYCDLCEYKSKHKYYLVMHMRTHTGEKPYRCSECAATFVNPSNLNKHRLTHKEKQFQCRLCGKSFRTNTALREHNEAAHMNLKHTCKFCGRDFCYKSDLRKHEIRYHNRVKRDYIGGEPSYKQVERLQQQQEPAPAPGPVPPPAPGNWLEVEVVPPACVYPTQQVYVHHPIQAQPSASIVMPLTQVTSEPSLKKDEPKIYVPQNVHFFSFASQQ